jgi:hypothetical protein
MGVELLVVRQSKVFDFTTGWCDSQLEFIFKSDYRSTG